MQSEKEGIAGFILKESENAIVAHCCMHNLDLSISASARIELFDNMIELYKNIKNLLLQTVFKERNLIELYNGN